MNHQILNRPIQNHAKSIDPPNHSKNPLKDRYNQYNPSLFQKIRKVRKKINATAAGGGPLRRAPRSARRWPVSSAAASGRLAPWQRRPPPRAFRGCQWPAHSVAAAAGLRARLLPAAGVFRGGGGSRAPWPAAARGQLLVRRRWLASPPSPRRCRGAAHRPALERRQRLARPLHAARRTPAACRTAPARGGGRKMRKGGESDKGEREGVGELQIKETRGVGAASIVPVPVPTRD